MQVCLLEARVEEDEEVEEVGEKEGLQGDQWPCHSRSPGSETLV